MRRIVAFLLCFLIAGAAAAQDKLPIPDIEYERFVLENGLTVIIHEDHSSPVVAVNVWYHVGSKNESPGKTGFAHLFEHLMFNGSEHYNDDYFKPFDKVGATDMNGTTNSDRTNYFETVPSTALDMALWMESDRMCCMIGAITQAKLNEQRGVVKNEKRQGANQPYGEVSKYIRHNAYPEGHPYHHTVIGSMEDLNAASLEDVHQWFQTYYGPNNATLTIAGDVDTQTALKKVKHYFGGIEPSPPIAHQAVWVAKREGSHRQIVQERVPQARIYKVWNVPELTDPRSEYLSLFADILGSGKNSRLYERLVYEEGVATDVSASVWQHELGSLFVVSATAKQGVDLDTVEAMLDEEMAQLLEEGFSEKELSRVKTGYFANFIRGIEQVGGFVGKANVLASSQVYFGSPDAYKKTLKTIRGATEEIIMKTARNWLQDGVYVLEIHPYPEWNAAETDVTREDGPPMPDEFPTVNFTDYETATLDNGLTLVVANHDAVPVVEFSLLVNAGYAADQGTKLGTASLTLDMMNEGTEKLNALEIAAKLDRLGAHLRLGSDLDTSYARLSALKVNLEPSLKLYSNIILHPTFPKEDLKRLRSMQLAAIKQEMVRPISMALRLFPQVIYKDSHAYSIPFTGSGTLKSVRSITRQDLVEFHETWFRPNNATLIVVGATTMEQVKPLVKEYFGDWESGEVPEKNIGPDELRDQGVVYVVDRPGSEQSVIIAGHTVPPYGMDDKLALSVANSVLGGSFTARLNMNLREDKHWSYGARSMILPAKGPRPFLAYAPVQTDKTAEAMVEIQQEIKSLVSDNPPTAREVSRVKDQKTLTLPGRWETASAVLNSLGEVVRFGLDSDYWDTYPERIRSLTLEAVRNAADTYIHPRKLVWVVVGDWARIEEGVRNLNLGEIHLVDLKGADTAE